MKIGGYIAIAVGVAVALGVFSGIGTQETFPEIVIDSDIITSHEKISGKDQLMIYGMVDDVREDIPVTIIVRDENGDTVTVEQTIPSDTGEFGYLIIMEDKIWKDSDTYTVQANYEALVDEPLLIDEPDLIESFDECVAAGNPVMESYPRQCRTGDGLHFFEEIPGLIVLIDGDKQVRRGTTHNIQVKVLRDGIPVEGAMVRIDIEDYGEDLIKELNGYTNSQGIFVLSWEIPQSFDDIETLLAIVDVTDDISAKTELFKFQVYCLPGEKNCKVEGN